MARTLANTQPEWREGRGVNNLITIPAGTQNATLTKFWKHTVDPNTPSDKNGYAYQLTYWDIIVGAGSNASGGSWTYLIRINGTQVASLSIAYNATDLYNSANLRDGSGFGIGVKPGDVVTMDISAVPTTGSSLSYPYAIINLNFESLHADA